MISYLGKRLAIDIIIPGIDFWSKQALSLSAGERESKAYKDRAEDLKELRKQLVAIPPRCWEKSKQSCRGCQDG